MERVIIARNFTNGSVLIPLVLTGSELYVLNARIAVFAVGVNGFLKKLADFSKQIVVFLAHAPIHACAPCGLRLGSRSRFSRGFS